MLRELADAIVVGDLGRVSRMLEASPELARAAFPTGATRQDPKSWRLAGIGRYIYAGDTALHIAAAGYRTAIVRRLLECGADVRVRNRRGAEPLHDAASGQPGSHTWNPAAQADTIAALIAAGADPNAAANGGVTPLHRAVRTRCAGAVQALLAGGADPSRKNKSGSTPLFLAGRSTGRGGSGSPDAKAQQERILKLLGE